MNKQKDKTWIAGAVLAVSASLCCITPVLALISGVGGIAATFSWLEPVRPYLIGITILVLGFAWYQKLKLRKKEEVNCECETDEKRSFWQGKTFLSIITVFAALMIAFPHYGHIFYPKSPVANVIFVEKNNIQQVEIKISGMDCQTCSEHINHALDKVAGVLEHITSYEKGTSFVKFDGSKATQQALVDAVNSTGYEVTEIKTIEK